MTILFISLKQNKKKHQIRADESPVYFSLIMSSMSTSHWPKKNFILYFCHIDSFSLICDSFLHSFRWQRAGVLSGVLLVEGHDGAAAHAWGKLQDGDLGEPHGRQGPRQDEGRQPPVGGDGQQNLAAVLWSALVAARGATEEMVEKNQVNSTLFVFQIPRRRGQAAAPRANWIWSAASFARLWGGTEKSRERWRWLHSYCCADPGRSETGPTVFFSFLWY